MNLRRCLQPLLFLLACLVGAGGPLWAAAPNDVARIIFDSDMSSDHDDLADLAVLHGLADLGECEILACMTSSQNGGSPLCMNAINAYYGRPNIPCGRRADSGGLGNYPATIASEFPHPLYATWQECPLVVDLYRQVLAAQPDHSVAIVTTGYLNNLQGLMQSGPDQYSSLNGMDLIRQKVKLLSCAGGCYPSGDEFNLRVEPAAAFYVINHWPTAAFFDGYDVGQDIYSGGDLQQTGAFNPIRRGFELTFFGPYPTWGQLMVYYAVRTAESQGLWNYNTTGHNNCDATGHNWWSTESDSSGAQEQGYMLEIQRFPIQEAIDTLVMNSGAPRSRGTVSPPNKPSNLRATPVGGNRIDLQWTDNSWNETAFILERKVNGVFTPIATLGAETTTYADTGLSSTANVAYRLKAINAIGGSGYATITVYSGGWSEHNLTNPGDHTPIYHYYQYDNLNWIRGPNVCSHLTVNNDSTHGQDLTVTVKVGAQGGYGRFHIYFFYQDQNNWYRVNTGSSGQGAANYTSWFEKSINGTITRIGATGEGVNIGNGSMMQTWQLTVSHTGALQFFTNNNATANPEPTMHQVLNASDTFSFSGGLIALGTDIGQPVWDDFSFDAASGAGGGGGGIIVATGLTLAPATSVVNPNAAVTLNAIISPANATSPIYAWYRNGSASASGGTLISGQTASTYAPTTATAGTGYYYATATAGGATVTSNAVTVTVTAAAVAPVITSQPANVTVDVGQTATVTVAASGTAPLSYQWKRGTTNVGSNSATLGIANAQAADAGSYTCTVGNSAGSATSNAATLTVNAGGGLDPLIPWTALISDGGGGYGGSGNTADKAFDGNTATFYDPANGGSAYTGIDVGAGNAATVTAIRFQARAGWPQRMIGGIFEGSDAPTSGYVTLATVGSASDTAWTTVTVTGASPYRYLRYRTPASGWCNVAEIEFHGTSGSSNPVVPPPTPPPIPATPTVSGDHTTAPLIAGTGLPGSTIHIRDGASEIGTVTVAGDGSWSYAVGALAAGIHVITVTASNANGTSAASPAVTVTVVASTNPGGANATSDPGHATGQGCGAGSMALLIAGMCCLLVGVGIRR